MSYAMQQLHGDDSGDDGRQGKQGSRQATWSSLPDDVRPTILKHLAFPQLFLLRAVSKEWCTILSASGFRRSVVSQEGTFSIIAPECPAPGETIGSGFDPFSRRWRAMPSLVDHGCGLLASHRGLAVVTAGGRCSTYICNPLLQVRRMLPPNITLSQLHRNFVHLVVDGNTKEYKVFCISFQSQYWSDRPRGGVVQDFEFSRVEVFDSAAGTWTQLPSQRPHNLRAMARVPVVATWTQSVYYQGVVYCFGRERRALPGAPAGPGYYRQQMGSTYSMLAFDTTRCVWEGPYPGPCSLLRKPHLVQCGGELLLLATGDINMVYRFCVADKSWILVDWLLELVDPQGSPLLEVKHVVALRDSIFLFSSDVGVDIDLRMIQCYDTSAKRWHRWKPYESLKVALRQLFSSPKSFVVYEPSLLLPG